MPEEKSLSVVALWLDGLKPPIDKKSENKRLLSHPPEAGLSTEQSFKFNPFADNS